MANPSLPISAVNFTSDVALADALDAPLLNSTNPDLSRFESHGGKLIQYAGWGDAAIAPKNGLNYYNSVLLTSPSFTSDRDRGVERLHDFYRVFMVPGMSHCSGGPGPNNFGNTFPVADRGHNIVTALDTWVERGIAPNRIIATKYVNDVPADGIAFQRPLCVYPLMAKYIGSGSSSHAENFACMEDKADKLAYSDDLIRAFRYVLTNWNILHNPPE